MAPAPVIRPLLDEDVEACRNLHLRSFDTDPAMADPEHGRARFRHALEHDPGGAWVAVDADDRPTGVALAVVRERLWVLGLLAVGPEAQSTGTGRALMARALAYGADRCDGWLTASSQDPRAMRTYARAGLGLVPTVTAQGRPQDVELPASVRTGTQADVAHIDAIDRRVRGAAHGIDVCLNSRPADRSLWIHDEGYAAGGPPWLCCVAALREQVAQELLRAVLASWPAGADCYVSWITREQGWAVPVVLDAGLSLKADGPLFMRGTMGPMTPYLPTGAWL